MECLAFFVRYLDSRYALTKCKRYRYTPPTISPPKQPKAKTTRARNQNPSRRNLHDLCAPFSPSESENENMSASERVSTPKPKWDSTQSTPPRKGSPQVSRFGEHRGKGEKIPPGTGGELDSLSNLLTDFELDEDQLSLQAFSDLQSSTTASNLPSSPIVRRERPKKGSKRERRRSTKIEKSDTSNSDEIVSAFSSRVPRSRTSSYN